MLRFASYSTSQRLEPAATSSIGDAHANLEGSLALRAATTTEVGGVAGTDASGADVDRKLGRRVGGKIHCG